MIKRSKAEPNTGSEGFADERIRIRGARVHNLRNVDVDIPRDKLVVVTGPSGSGKSSLAFDTLYAEGQRQYIESLSVYARQFLNQMERPDVDLIDGLQPTISIDQKTGSHNPRSTVATVTEVYDHLRLLMARVGQPFCYQCDEAISQQTLEEIQQRLAQLAEETKIMLLAPMVRGRKGMHGETFAAIRRAGFAKVRIDGTVYPLESIPQLEPRRTHTIEAVVDRLKVRSSAQTRLAESLALAIRHGEGLVLAVIQDPQPVDRKTGPSGEWREELFSTLYACPNCKVSFEELEPRTFSFNSPYGACPACQGLGQSEQFDPDLVIPDPTQSIEQGAIAPWKHLTPAVRKKQGAAVAAAFPRRPQLLEEPWESIPEKTQLRLLHGEGSTVGDKADRAKKSKPGKSKNFDGLLIALEKMLATTTKPALRDQLEGYRGCVVCSDCQGSRLRPEARACRLDGATIQQIGAMPINRAREYFAELAIDEEDEPIARPILREIERRLEFLIKVGVQYLSLDRPADTLSGGESQRVRLATGIGSGLVGVCYVLDEPSIGLHPRDNQRLIDALRELQQQGNTVVVVEHDEATMREADCLIDIGPGAGTHGGEVVAIGTPEEVEANPASLTASYLSGRQQIAIPATRRKFVKSRCITLEGATANNLKDVSAQFPLATLTCITGVSGSGKSSLITETLAPALSHRLGQGGKKPAAHRSLRGVSQIQRLIQVDQSPIGRTPRSNPATYTGLFDGIRKIFASTRGAKQRGYTVGRFSFNVAGGRCEACQGQGFQKIEMNFLPDIYVTCGECSGARFNRQTQQVKYREKSIAEVLQMRVDEALSFFENFPQVHRMINSLHDVGLGYLPLGQPSTTLSGGEAQRIKLASELGRVDGGGALYILDEPTTGLHLDDIRRLLEVLSRLVDMGNTVIVIEHHLDVVKGADWLIDLGPEGGEAGGEIVATGTPEEIALLAGNHTGEHLRAHLRL